MENTKCDLGTISEEVCDLMSEETLAEVNRQLLVLAHEDRKYDTYVEARVFLARSVANDFAREYYSFAAKMYNSPELYASWQYGELSKEEVRGAVRVALRLHLAELPRWKRIKVKATMPIGSY